MFDFDGLILDTESLSYDSYKQSMESFGLPFPLDIFRACIGTHDQAMNEYLLEASGSAEKVAEIKQLARKLHEEKVVLEKEREGVKEYLEEARQLGLRIGLASSSNRSWIERFLAQLDLRHYFEVIKTSDDVSAIKPDPELYIAAVEALGVSPQEALAFEDSVNGSKAAHAAGLRCVIVPNRVTESLPFQNFDLRIRSMGDQSLVSLIQQLDHNRQEHN